MCNEKIRNKARNRGIMLWQIAAALGITDNSFSRKLRFELPEDEQKRIIEVIDQLADERERSGAND